MYWLNCGDVLSVHSSGLQYRYAYPVSLPLFVPTTLNRESPVCFDRAPRVYFFSLRLDRWQAVLGFCVTLLALAKQPRLASTVSKVSEPRNLLTQPQR